MGEGDPLDTQRYPPSPAAELAGTGFDDVQEIGRGGFGVVYRCTQAELDRTVAVKVLTVELDDENRSRFFREQRAMGRLTGHPNIVNILQVGATDSGLPYIVMPYHPQDSLEARVREDGPLPLDQVLRLGVKMAGAVESTHRSGFCIGTSNPGTFCSPITGSRSWRISVSRTSAAGSRLRPVR
ncbi:transcriptional regulator, LuxR family [Rhodococcus opacus]|uniref:non-specific serine/threonine protein kinase n=1 Tax=Rhodococcus opacus TaxID=37919 RepID=A0A1B1KEK2_RHOOP|nr:transcriptional regulator, LuxR family [Rhodococcus opacus]